jgi:hypothetical protein
MEFEFPYEITGKKIIRAESEADARLKFLAIPVEDLAVEGELESYEPKLKEDVPS